MSLCSFICNEVRSYIANAAHIAIPYVTGSAKTLHVCVRILTYF